MYKEVEYGFYNLKKNPLIFISGILWMFPAFAVMRGSGAFVQRIENSKLSMVLALLDGEY